MRRTGKYNRLNIVVKITTPSGWRSEWDFGFGDDATIADVTLSRFNPQNTPDTMCRPVRLTFEQFYAEFQKIHAQARA